MFEYKIASYGSILTKPVRLSHGIINGLPRPATPNIIRCESVKCNFNRQVLFCLRFCLPGRAWPMIILNA